MNIFEKQNLLRKQKCMTNMYDVHRDTKKSLVLVQKKKTRNFQTQDTRYAQSASCFVFSVPFVGKLLSSCQRTDFAPPC